MFKIYSTVKRLVKIRITLIVVLTVLIVSVTHINAEVVGDVNGDNKIGLEEAVFALQVVSGAVPSPNTQSIIGSWWQGGGTLPENEITVVTFLNSTHYFVGEIGGTPEFEGGGPGMELGTYIWNPSTGEFIATVLEETNGDWGLAELNDPSTFTVSLNGNTLSFIDGTDTFELFKIVP